MNFKSFTALPAAMALCAPVAFAADMADEMTIVSWGGAYSKSQLRAYHEPYSANTGVTIINDDSSAEAVAKLRAMNEAGNVTWDVVDVVAADAMRLCDEGLALEIDADTQLAAAPDGTPASEDFGDSSSRSASFRRSSTRRRSAIAPIWSARRRPRSPRPGRFLARHRCLPRCHQRPGTGRRTGRPQFCPGR